MYVYSERERDFTATKPKSPQCQRFIHIRSFIIEASSKTTGGHLFKLPPLWSKVHKMNAYFRERSQLLLQFTELHTHSVAYSTTMSFSELSEWEKTLFSEYWSRGEGTKCKRFDQIDLLSRSSAGVWTSLSRASAGCTGNLRSLICVIVRGETQNESSIIHSGHIQQVIVCCCITSAPEKRFIHLHAWQEYP